MHNNSAVATYIDATEEWVFLILQAQVCNATIVPSRTQSVQSINQSVHSIKHGIDSTMLLDIRRILGACQLHVDLADALGDTLECCAECLATKRGHLGKTRFGIAILFARLIERGLGVLEALFNLLKVLAGLEIRVDLVDLGLALLDRLNVLAENGFASIDIAILDDTRNVRWVGKRCTNAITR
jgi:hypothetical protein